MFSLRYFKPIEFARCVPSCKMEECDEQALLMLDELRHRLGRPITLNCAYRSVNHEKKKGRSGLSSHCKGIAFDVRCYDSRYRAELVRCALEVGFTRIGISTSFVHLDCDKSKLNPSIWLY